MQREKRVNPRRVYNRCLAALLVCAWTPAVAAHAQAISPSDAAPVRMHGVVLNAITQAPIRRALVTTLDQHMAVMTDDKGRFEFEARVPANSAPADDGAGSRSFTSDVFLTVRKPGYLADQRPVDVPLSGQNALKAELLLHLMPEAMIAGTVSTDNAESISGLNVLLLSRQVQDGRAIWMQVQTLQVDAHGRFRFGALVPGQYKVETAEWIERLGQLMLPGDKPLLGFPPQAYPNGTSPATAEIIHLGGGQSIVADLTLRAVPYYTVDIPLLNNTAASVVGVSVSKENGSRFSLGFSGQPPHVEGFLPDGSYHVTVTQSGGPDQQGALQSILTGTQELTIAGKPVHGPPITCMRGASVPIHVREEYTGPDPNEQNNTGSSPPPSQVVQEDPAPPGGVVGGSINVTGQAQEVVLPPPHSVDVSLTPADETSGMVAGNQVDQPGGKGSSIENVFPGKYTVQANARRGYIASLTANGVNLLREPLVIQAGSGAPAMEIVVRDDFATITGTVSTSGAKGVLSAPLLVMAFPLDENSTRPNGGIVEGGRFSIPNAVPGKYFLLAVSGQALNLEYRSKEAMMAYESKGMIVDIAPRQTLTIELKSAITSNDWAGQAASD